MEPAREGQRRQVPQGSLPNNAPGPSCRLHPVFRVSAEGRTLGFR